MEADTLSLSRVVRSTGWQFSPIILLLWLLIPAPVQGETVIAEALLSENPSGIYLAGDWTWRFRVGDKTQWAESGYDDTSWKTTTATRDLDFIPVPDWRGVGWFRCHLRVEKALRGKPAVIQVRHLGAYEVLLNGKPISRIGDDRSGDKTTATGNWKAFVFDDEPIQVLAVRYINHGLVPQRNLGFRAGFTVVLRNFDTAISGRNSQIIFLSRYKILLTVTPMVLAFLHLFLFLFYPRMKEHLFYFFCLVGFSVFFYSIMQRYLSSDPGEIVLLFRIGPVLNIFTVSFLLLTCYYIIYSQIPKQSAYFIVPALLIAGWGVFKPLGLINYGLFLFTTVIIFEILRAFIFNRPRHKKGSWIILIGIAALAAISLYQIIDVILPMIADGITVPPRSYYRVYTYGGTVFIVCMSIFLSYQFARTNKDLEIQLDQVKKLSEKNLRQERQARRREIEKRLLEAENARKTKELEEARKLQLSMLPENIPELSDLEIAVLMKTATEVGGDYYDFHLGEEVTLTVAIGDATGHGMKAGTMVTAAKSLFGTYHESVQIPDFFNHCTKVFKGMNLGKLYMALMILRFEKNKISLSTAGMPPAFLFRAKQKTLDEILIKGPPLGAFSDFSYQTRETRIDQGDVLLLMSDGLPERFNPKGEMMGMARVKKAFLDVAESPPAQIIAALDEAGEAWGGGSTQDDDITFVVIKRK